MADPLLDVLVAAVIERLPRPTPANDGSPAWRTLAAEARIRGKSVRAFRRWCTSHGVEIRQDSHRDAWVSPAQVDRAVEGFAPVATRQHVADEVDAAIEAARQRRAR